MKQVFRTNKPSGMAPSVTELTLFLNNTGKLSLVTYRTLFLKDGEQPSEHIWSGDANKTQDWNFNDASPEDLRYPFKELALRNPKDFRTLYYTLKEHDEKTFPIIQSVLKEVQQLFNFS